MISQQHGMSGERSSCFISNQIHQQSCTKSVVSAKLGFFNVSKAKCVHKCIPYRSMPMFWNVKGNVEHLKLKVSAYNIYIYMCVGIYIYICKIKAVHARTLPKGVYREGLQRAFGSSSLKINVQMEQLTLCLTNPTRRLRVSLEVSFVNESGVHLLAIGQGGLGKTMFCRQKASKKVGFSRWFSSRKNRNIWVTLW